jgi:hypothetical protein
LPQPPSKSPRGTHRTDAAETLSLAQLQTFSPVQLRARVLRLLEMADEFPDLEHLLLGLAVELSNRADALEGKG